jgi:hypothetical protein
LAYTFNLTITIVLNNWQIVILNHWSYELALTGAIDFKMLISLHFLQGTSGAYFFGGKGRTINSSALSRNAKLAHELWETTCNMLSVTPFDNERDSF